MIVATSKTGIIGPAQDALSARDVSPEQAEIDHEEQLRLRSLVAAGLLSDSPDNESGLVFPLPSGAEIISIIAGYDSNRSIGRKIRCAACPQHQLHYRGFRVELQAGSQANIGFNCGEKHFGAGAWQIALNDYDRRVEDAHFRARVAPALKMLENVVPLIEAWHDKTKKLAKEFSDFHRLLPELYSGVVDASRLRDGRLELERRVRRGAVNRLGLVEEKFVTDVTVIGRIPAPQLFLGGGPNSFLSGARHDIEAATVSLQTKRDTLSMATAFRGLQRARQRLRDAADRHRATLLVLQPQWLTPLCKWANQNEVISGHYAVDGRAITRLDDIIEPTFVLPLPEMVGEPPIDEIEAQWRTVGDKAL